jgi:hypothetical protein
MRTLCLTFLAAAVMVLAVLALGLAARPAAAHQSGCHRWHTCPSDHATYRWKGLLCVKPTADERTSAYRKRVVYQGRVYYCKR